MVVVPDVTPVTTPKPFTVATEVLLLVHAPPPAASVRVSGTPRHTKVPPLMLPGSGRAFTVLEAVAIAMPQPLDMVYDMVTVPDDTPMTWPEPSTVATVADPLLHTPPATPSVRVICEPTHTLAGPETDPDDGVVLTVTE